MDRRAFISGITIGLLAAPLAAESQQSSQMIEEAQLPLWAQAESQDALIRRLP
jgi:hypothetical protein